MKERPILFSGPMVRGILEGLKTQTRRIAKDPRGLYASCGSHEIHPAVSAFTNVGNGEFSQDASDAIKQQYISTFPFHRLRCPYGQPGDRLWVRETWSFGGNGPFYRADVAQPETVKYSWKPSRHMRREYSRILLEVVSVRVERLQDISEEDAKAEGVLSLGPAERIYGPRHWQERGFSSNETCLFHDLWESINGAGSWDANPWVWVVEFKRLSEPESLEATA